MHASDEQAAGRATLAYAFGPFTVDVRERRLRRDGVDVALTNKAFDVLLALLEGSGRLQTREALIRSIWQGVIVEEHGLTGYLSMVRKALGDTGPSPVYIETVRRHGYRFIAPVRVLESASAVDAADQDVPPAPAAEPPPVSSRRRRVMTGSVIALIALAAAVWGWQVSRTRGAASPSPRSLAILPFENLGPDKDVAYFVSGVQNMVAVKLTGIANLRVVSRSSTEGYASRPQDLVRTADELGVATLLEGSVQKAGERVRISVQLVDARSGTTVWAQAYTRTLDDAFRVESDIAEQVALALKADVQPSEATRVASIPTADAQAYTRFLQADYLSWQLQNWGVWGAGDMTEALARATDLYRQALARDPDFALAYARLSYMESYAYWIFIDHSAARIADAEAAARRALALAPDLPQSQLAMGYVNYYGYRDYAAALVQFERARRLLPNDPEVVGAIAHIHRRQGRLAEAMAGYAEAAALDPRQANWLNLIADTQAMQRDYVQAAETYDRAQAVDPRNHYAAVNRAQMHLFNAASGQALLALQDIPSGVGPSGVSQSMRFQIAWLEHKPRQALTELQGAPDWVDNPWMLGSTPTALLRAVAGDSGGEEAAARRDYETARAQLQTVLREDPDNPMWLSLLGIVEAGLGDAEAAVRLATRAIENLSVEKDAYDGPFYLMNLAQIHARNGDMAQSQELVQRLLAMPAGLAISAPLARRDPRFHAGWKTENGAASLTGFPGGTEDRAGTREVSSSGLDDRAGVASKPAPHATPSSTKRV